MKKLTCPECNGSLINTSYHKKTVFSCPHGHGRWESNIGSISAQQDLVIGFMPSQKELYKVDPKSSIYYPRGESEEIFIRNTTGINKDGRFYEMVAKKYFDDLGYTVRYSTGGLARRHHRDDETYNIMREIFKDRLRDAINKIDEEKITGGDPDLFVYREGPLSDYFFVEVKGPNDSIQPNQSILFPILNQFLCHVYIVRVRPLDGHIINVGASHNKVIRRPRKP